MPTDWYLLFTSYIIKFERLSLRETGLRLEAEGRLSLIWWPVVLLRSTAMKYKKFNSIGCLLLMTSSVSPVLSS